MATGLLLLNRSRCRSFNVVRPQPPAVAAATPFTNLVAGPWPNLGLEDDGPPKMSSGVRTGAKGTLVPRRRKAFRLAVQA